MYVDTSKCLSIWNSITTHYFAVTSLGSSYIYHAGTETIYVKHMLELVGYIRNIVYV